MGYKDLREFIDRLEEKEELVRVKAEVDWNREIGAITRKVLNKKGKALLFENIKDYKDTPCTKFATNLVGSRRRLCIALGLDEDASYKEITKFMKERFSKRTEPIKVDKGPVKENIIKGDEVDLFKFPVPKWHHMDGGRYINTFAAIVTMDPETKLMNVGMYRGMIGSKNTIPVLLASSQHWGMHFSKYRNMNKPMPVACVYGWDPALFICAAVPLQHPDCSEYEIAGALRGEPIELVKCETSDLYVPAWAEMVIEGFISPDPNTYEMEGPFGEYPGYYGGMASPKPRIKVECITFRNDPILRGALEGTSPGRWAESAHFASAGFCAVAWNFLESVGVPNILDVWSPPVTDSTNIRVKIRKIYRGHAKQIANALWGSSIGNYAAKNVIVVDEDIDIHDDEAVEWAIAYRVNPDMNDIIFFPGTIGSMLDPSVPLELRNVPKYGQGKWCRTLIDATKNWELERQEQYGGELYPPLATDIDPEDERLIDKRWKEYGIE